MTRRVVHQILDHAREIYCGDVDGTLAQLPPVAKWEAVRFLVSNGLSETQAATTCGVTVE